MTEVEPEFINLTLDREDKKEIAIRIRNIDRDYLFGAVEFSTGFDSMFLSEASFGVDPKLNQETAIILHIDASKITPGQNYNTSVEIASNAENGEISIPVTVRVYRNPLKLLLHCG